MRTPAEIATAFASRDVLDGKRRLFMVGIGGAGMSALARLARDRGLIVEGSDSTRSPEVERLQSEGFAVAIGHRALPEQSESEIAATAMVLTDAVPLDISPEVASARALGIPILRRSQLLGWLLKGRKVIAITGTHGKTTTTGMTGAALEASGLDPLVIVGASIPQWNGPVRYGQGEWAVVEACEAYDSFHDLDPTVVVLTNLELDHVDFHINWENLRGSVTRFVQKLEHADGGTLVYCGEDAGAKEIADRVRGIREIEYGHGAADWELGIPGAHNRLNGQGALAAARVAGADEDLAKAGIASFHGAERRLQLLYDGEIRVYDDYAHHPTEIAASLTALREKSADRRLIVVFQPHLYSRTAPLIQEFADALSLADVVVLTDIYPAREDPMPGISAALIAERIAKTTRYVPSRHLLPRKVAALAQAGDVIVGMGAGNIAEFAAAFVDEIRRAERTALEVVVLYGGDSAEREVSLHSGRAVASALTRNGHRVNLVDMTDLLHGKGDLRSFLGAGRPDVAFLAVHGTHAEDGAIQGLLEMLHIPYTGSGIQASSIAMDKAMTKQILSAHGIRVPRGVRLDEMEVPLDLPPPLIVKPNAQGSTVGLSFVEEPSQLCPALANAFAYDDSVLVEEWITGMEISVPVLDDRALPPVEIAPASGRYDFASKYQPGATEEIVPARLPKEVLEQAQRIAEKAHRVLGCAGATRTDMMVRNPQSEEPEIFVLEVNTLPGMTATSLLPNSARAAGIDFDQLCARILQDALRRHAAKA